MSAADLQDTSGLPRLVRTVASPRFSYSFLLSLTVVTAALAIKNAALIFDDLALPSGFASLTESRGRILAALSVFVGDGLPSEYRTYGISRALHYVLWEIGGNNPRLYALWIAATQGLSALMLHSILRRRTVRTDIALALPIVWMCSPFAITNCFHHYTYLIFPWQVLIGVAWYGELLITRSTVLTSKQRLLAIGSGAALALSGEAHLVAAFGLLLFFAVRERRTTRGRWMSLAAISAVVSLVVHYVLWQTLIFNRQMPQRFNLALTDPDTVKLMGERAPLIFDSFVVGLSQPISYIWEHSYRSILVSVGIGTLVASVLLLSRCASADPGPTPGKENASRARLGDARLGCYLGLFFLASVCLYGIVMLKVGNIAEIFPRRYGYVPYTILSACALVLTASVFGTRQRTWLIAAFVAAYLALYFQMEIEILPDARAEDVKVTQQIQQLHGRCPQCAILFGDREPIDRTHLMDNSTPGLRGGGPALDLIESPYVAYWVQSLYVKNVIGVPLIGWAVEPAPGNLLKMFVNPPKEAIEVAQDRVAIVANLSMAGQARSLDNVHVFDRWEDFAERVSGVTIEHEKDLVLAFAPTFDRSNLFTIDMGRSPGNPALGIFEDKTFDQRPIGELPKDGFVDRYGVVSGSDSVYTVPDGKVPTYYASNRNGDFVYRIDFQPDRVESAIVSLDFWELWHRKTGERRFAIDFKLNGGAWDTSTELDIVAVGGNEPVALRFAVQNPRTVLIRFRKVPGSSDIPFIQGIRLAKIR